MNLPIAREIFVYFDWLNLCFFVGGSPINGACMKKNLPAFLIIPIVFISCQPPRYIYSPAPPNNPYFRQKGESKITAYYSTSGSENDAEKEYDNGFDLQAAYALTDHWALTTDYYKRDEKQVEIDSDGQFFQRAAIRYDRKISSLGAGYFVTLTKNKAIMFNAFAGVGFGRFSFDDYGLNNGTDYGRNYKNEITKWYVQPSLNFFPGKNLRTALTGKISCIYYHNAVTNYTLPELEFLDLHELSEKTFGFFEFSWNMGVSLEKLPWMHVEGSITLCTEAFHNYANLEARNLNASIGLSFDLSKMKPK